MHAGDVIGCPASLGSHQLRHPAQGGQTTRQDAEQLNHDAMGPSLATPAGGVVLALMTSSVGKSSTWVTSPATSASASAADVLPCSNSP